MQITETEAGAVTVLVPQGPLCGADAKGFRDAALDAMRRHRGRLIVDASGVPFADSEGLEALLDLTETLASGGRSLKICQPSDTLREALDIVGISGLFELYPDVNAAVRSFL
jgi:anti-sigma B factor antagonist